MIPPEGTLNEAETRAQIDAALISAGWVIQDNKRFNQQVGLRVDNTATDLGKNRSTAFIPSPLYS